MVEVHPQDAALDRIAFEQFGAALAGNERAFGWLRESALGPEDWTSSEWAQLQLGCVCPRTPPGELHQFAPNGGPNTAISRMFRRIALVFGFILIYRPTT